MTKARTTRVPVNVRRVLGRLRSGILFLFCLFVLCLVLGFSGVP